MIIFLVFIILILLMFAGIPVAFATGMASTAHFLMLGNTKFLTILPQRMFAGVNSTELLCIAYFVLAGILMNAFGITEKLFDFCRELVGWVRGGLAYATIIVAVILSAILGSANAVTAILCMSAVPEMKKDGYDGAFASSLVSAAGVLGPLIPPSVGFVMIAALVGSSVRALFMSGIIPGIIIAIAYAIVIVIQTRRAQYPKYRDRVDGKALRKSFIKAAPSLLIPFIMIGGVTFGWFTPSESGAVAVAATVICALIYKTFSFKKLITSLKSASTATAGIMLIVAFGNILGWSLAIDQIPTKLTRAVLSVSNSPLFVMGALLVIMFFVGMFVDGFAAILIFAPIFAPMATSVGINLVHFCLIFSIMIKIGLITPPVGMCLFVSSNLTKEPLAKISKKIWPFVIASTLATILLAYAEPLTLWLPRALGMMF